MPTEIRLVTTGPLCIARSAAGWAGGGAVATSVEGWCIPYAAAADRAGADVGGAGLGGSNASASLRPRPPISSARLGTGGSGLPCWPLIGEPVAWAGRNGRTVGRSVLLCSTAVGRGDGRAGPEVAMWL